MGQISPVARGCCSGLGDKKLQIAGSVATVIAVAAVAMGILCFIASTYGGFGNLNSIGTLGSAILTGSGAAALILAVIGLCTACKKRSSAETHVKMCTHDQIIDIVLKDGKARYYIEGQEIQPDQFPDCKRLIDYRQFPQEFLQAVNQVAHELHITNIDAHLKKLYGDLAQTLFVSFEDLMGQSNLESFQRQVKLLLVTDTEFLSLPLLELKNVRYRELDLLHFRLNRIETSHTYQDTKTKKSWNDFNIATCTLNDFRSIEGKSIFTNFPKKELSVDGHNLFAPMLGWLKASQVTEIIKNWEHVKDAMLQDYLMTALTRLSCPNARDLSGVIHTLSVTELIPCFKYFYAREYAWFSDEQLLSPDFPWEEINIDRLELDEAHIQSTRRILRCMNDDTIKLLLARWRFHKLHPEHVRLFSDQQFKSKTFPWAEIAELEQTRPDGWLFVTEDSVEEKSTILESKRILQLLDDDAIKILAPKFSGRQLRLLSAKQINSTHFPLQDILKSPEKLNHWLEVSIFGLLDPEQQTTEKIWKALDPKVKAILGPHLSDKQKQFLSYSGT